MQCTRHRRQGPHLGLVVATNKIAEQLVARHLLAGPPQLRGFDGHALLRHAVGVEVVVEAERVVEGVLVGVGVAVDDGARGVLDEVADASAQFAGA